MNWEKRRVKLKLHCNKLVDLSSRRFTDAILIIGRSSGSPHFLRPSQSPFSSTKGEKLPPQGGERFSGRMVFKALPGTLPRGGWRGNEAYSCGYSSGFAPDSLASAGGYAFPIANSGGKDKDFLYIIQLFLPDYFLFSSFCLSIGSIPLLLQVFPACRCRTNGGPEADNPVCRLFRTRIDKKE